MKEKEECSGQCKTCNLLGECPEDASFCDACGEEVETGYGIEIETEVIERGKHCKKMAVVCRDCYERFYLSDYLEDLIY